MKRYIVITFLFLGNLMFSQTLERSVIGSSGKTLSNANGSLNFTVGELVTATGSNNGVILAQGFHQEEIKLKIKLSPVVFLQGPLVTSGTAIMDDSLRSSDLIPTTSPYADAITCESSVFNVSGSDAIVDWVWVTLRDKNDYKTILSSQSALLQADGDIVDTDGTSELVIDLPIDSYYIAVNHRNHLGIMSATTYALNTTGVTMVNLSNSLSSIYGTANSVIDMGNGIYAMISGDFDENGQIQNTDANSVIQLLGVSGYYKADVNMNGQVQNSDVNNLVKPNIGKGEQF